jgi:predicted regulator of Ras-like GTPase activity (Roadblock/LC7/MglB family)
MNDSYTAAVERVSRIAGVRGALVVEPEAAVPVVAVLSEGVNGAAIAALAAALYRRMLQACDTAGAGELRTLQLQADEGHVVVVGAGDVILIAIAEHDAPVGMVLVGTLRAAEALA